MSITLMLMAVALHSYAGGVDPDFTPPASPVTSSSLVGEADSIMMPFPVQQTVPQRYEDFMEREFAADLTNPSNVTTVTEYDPQLGCYVIRTRVGETDVVTPFYLSPEQYNEWQNRRSMRDYFRMRNSEALTNPSKEPFNILDMNFALGPLEKIFGPGGVSLRTQGSMTLSMGIK